MAALAKQPVLRNFAGSLALFVSVCVTAATILVGPSPQEIDVRPLMVCIGLLGVGIAFCLDALSSHAKRERFFAGLGLFVLAAAAAWLAMGLLASYV